MGEAALPAAFAEHKAQLVPGGSGLVELPLPFANHQLEAAKRLFQVGGTPGCTMVAGGALHRLAQATCPQSCWDQFGPLFPSAPSTNFPVQAYVISLIVRKRQSDR